MNKQPKFSDQNINDFLSKADVPLKKDKELIWTEKFNSLIAPENKPQPDTISWFNFNWQYGIAASIAIIIAFTVYLKPLEKMQARTEFVELSVPEDELLADEKMIESLFVEDSEFDDWFEERYVLNTLN
ncbi:MAG: hypothetical protein CMC78_01570 [Flavobacteriaceae bacterium]|nr:hypothetical protein [Flavobacteriaceae bacterium]